MAIRLSACIGRRLSAKEFHLYKRKPLAFADYLYVSNNYFDRRWSGARRIKNVVVSLEWIPSLAGLIGREMEARQLTEKQEVALNKAFLLFDANNSGDISEDEMVQIIRAAVDFKPDNDQLKEMMDKFRSNDTKRIEYKEFH